MENLNIDLQLVTQIAYGLLISFAAFYLLWVLYLAVMNLSRARDAGKLTMVTKVLGYPVLFVGLLLDFVLNITVMTIILLELPREGTISSRLKRHNEQSTGWRKSVATWCEQLLDPFDPSGSHI